MTTQKLEQTILTAVELDRQIRADTDRLDEIKATLTTEAASRTEEHTGTDGGGSSWTATGADGSIVRVTFPAPTLKSKIDGGAKCFPKIKDAAGRYFDFLFVPVLAYRPAEDFRTKAANALPGAGANKLIKLCQTESAPKVSFETKDAARKD